MLNAMDLSVHGCTGFRTFLRVGDGYVVRKIIVEAGGISITLTLFTKDGERIPLRDAGEEVLLPH